jgi:hypothetical protein
VVEFYYAIAGFGIGYVTCNVVRYVEAWNIVRKYDVYLKRGTDE